MRDYLTVQEIAQKLDVTTDTVRRWLRAGKLKGTPLGRAGYRIHESDFQLFMGRRNENLQQLNKHKQSSAPKAHRLLSADSSTLPSGDYLPSLAYNAIFARDPMSVITAWNQEATRLYGWSEQEVLGQIAHTFLHTSFPISREEVELQLIQTGHWEGELRSIDRHGQEIIVESHQILRRNGQGHPDSILEIDRDITDHKQIEEMLHFLTKAGRTLNASLDYETTLQKIAALTISTLADFCAFDLLQPDQTIQRIACAHIQCEQASLYNQTFTFTPSMENLNHPVSRVLHSGLPEFVAHVDETWLQQTATSPEQAQFIRSSGLHSIMTVPLVAHNNILGTLTLCYTISNRHYTTQTLELATELANRTGMAIANARLYTEQIHAREQAETSAREIHEHKEQERRKGTFASVVSHELRTPLTAINANLQLAERCIKNILQQEEEPSLAIQGATNDALQMINRALRQSKVMNRLIGDLLDSTHIQANKLNLSLAEHDIITITRDTILDQLELTPQRSIQLAPLPDNQDIIVLIDKDRIRQVISNYLTNALKYSAASEEVAIGILVDAEHVRIWVRDHGPGLTAEQQAHIWDHHYQANDVTIQNGRNNGLGLGLHICKTLINRHGGEVGVDSKKGCGSTFWFQLPLAYTLYS